MNDAEELAISTLATVALNGDPDVKIAAARGLARYVQHKKAVSALQTIALNGDPRVKQACALALGGISGADE